MQAFAAIKALFSTSRQKIGPILGTCLASLVATASHAGATPNLADATSTVGVQCDSRGRPFNDHLGPVPAGVSLACDRSGGGPDNPWEYNSWQPVALVHTGFGATTGRVGVVDAVASARATGYRGEAASSAGGFVSYSIALIELASGAFSPAQLPIRFSASAEGHFTGHSDYGSGTMGSYSASAWMSTENFPISRFRMAHFDLSSDSEDSFNDSVVQWLNVSQAYSVTIGAGCGAHAFGSYIGRPPEGEPVSSRAECAAVVDPLLALDQAAFDLMYGSESFPLDQYYRLVYSPNIPANDPRQIPEPSALLLSLTGLGLLVNRRNSMTKKSPCLGWHGLL